MSSKNPNLRRAIIIRHRKTKKLCTRCGLDITEKCSNKECIEDYYQVDMRGVVVPKAPETDFEKRKLTITTYRQKKNLCLICGKELHEGSCSEDYIKSDNRTQEEKEYRPAIVKTPKTEKNFIISNILNNEVKPLVLLNKTQDIVFQRSAIIIRLIKSGTGNMVEYSCINQLSKKYKDFIVVLVGDAEKYFPYSDFLKIKKLNNIMLIKHLSKQDMINYISSAKKYFSFSDEYIDFCSKHSISYYQFSDNKNATNFLNLTAYQI